MGLFYCDLNSCVLSILQQETRHHHYHQSTNYIHHFHLIDSFVELLFIREIF